MPSLWMRSYPHTLIARMLNACVQVQQEFGRSRGIPWGISESGSARKDDGGHYSYYAYGVPQIALFYDATAGPVVSPYSSYLALGVDSVEAMPGEICRIALEQESIRRHREIAEAGHRHLQHRPDLVRAGRKASIVVSVELAIVIFISQWVAMLTILNLKESLSR